MWPMFPTSDTLAYWSCCWLQTYLGPTHKVQHLFEVSSWASFPHRSSGYMWYKLHSTFSENFKNKRISLYLLLTVVCLDLLPLRCSWWRRGRRGVQVWRPSWRRVDAATGRHHQERALHWRGWMDGGRPQREKGAVSWQLCQGEVEEFVFAELLNAEKCRFVLTHELWQRCSDRQTD